MRDQAWMSGVLAGLSIVLAGGLTGCGAGPAASCMEENFLSVAPATATIQSKAAAPANQQIFVAATGIKVISGMCAVPALLARAYPAWNNPDPIHISISSAADDSNGTAVCKGPTGGPVTLTATPGSGAAANSATVQLTCD